MDGPGRLGVNPQESQTGTGIGEAGVGLSVPKRGDGAGEGSRANDGARANSRAMSSGVAAAAGVGRKGEAQGSSVKVKGTGT